MHMPHTGKQTEAGFRIPSIRRRPESRTPNRSTTLDTGLRRYDGTLWFVLLGLILVMSGCATPSCAAPAIWAW